MRAPVEAAASVRTALAAIDDWLARPSTDSFPHGSVIAAYQWYGKHFVPRSLLLSLDRARDAYRTLGSREREKPAYRRLGNFLGVTLDKHDGRFDYRSYLTLPVLELPAADREFDSAQQWQRSRDRLFVLLICDLGRFELDAAAGRSGLLPERRPGPDRRARRCRAIVRSGEPALSRLGVEFGDTSGESRLYELCRVVDEDLSEAERLKLEASMLPVFTTHDEYLFIRILQCFELTFAWMAVRLRAALSMVDHDVHGVVENIVDAACMLEESFVLFLPLRTMQIQSFRDFRRYTDGASAIQSRNYKMVESLCRVPPGTRLDSVAYEAVPEIRERLLRKPESLQSALRTASTARALSEPESRRVHQAQDRLTRVLRKWQHAHLAAATRFLGQGVGTGYTEGVPYLRRALPRHERRPHR